MNELSQPNNKLLWTQKELADLTGFSIRTIQYMTQAGELPFIRLGRKTRYPVARILEWIEAKIQGNRDS